MVKAMILICSISTPPDKCNNLTAIETYEYPVEYTTCAYTAMPMVASDPRANMTTYTKITCGSKKEGLTGP